MARTLGMQTGYTMINSGRTEKGPGTGAAHDGDMQGHLRLADGKHSRLRPSAAGAAWIDAIEEAGRQGWYEPLRRPVRSKS